MRHRFDNDRAFLLAFSRGQVHCATWQATHLRFLFAVHLNNTNARSAACPLPLRQASLSLQERDASKIGSYFIINLRWKSTRRNKSEIANRAPESEQFSLSEGHSLPLAAIDVGDQSLGGATSNGNPGERDAVIRVSGQEISIYEALVCSSLDQT